MSATNGVMMQFFHWYSPADGSLWDEARARATELAEAGFTAVWLPPAYKGVNGAADVGYGVYDLYDLGEFDQKGSVRTKYGTKQQYLDAVRALQQAGLIARHQLVHCQRQIQRQSAPGWPGSQP